MKVQILSAFALCAALGAGADAWAESSFSEDFTGLTELPANLALGTQNHVGTEGTTTVGGGTVNWSETDYRQYVGTVESGYAAANFTYEATVTVENSTAFDATFFGMAQSYDSAGWSPAGTSVGMYIDPRPEWGVRGLMNGSPVPGDVAAVPGLAAGTYRLRMVWNASATEAVISIDENYAGGAFTADHTLDPLVNAGFGPVTPSDGRLFFGGGSGATFDDISVDVPSGSPGDFDSDGDVDGNDFLVWQRDLGDAANLALWEANFGTSSAPAATASVPEPSSVLILCSILPLLFVRGRKGGK